MSNTKTRFTKVSEYIAAGAMEVGFLMESPIRETEKALGFKGVKFNAGVLAHADENLSDQ